MAEDSHSRGDQRSASDDADESEVGATLDPELVRLPLSRSRLRPLTGFAIIVICLVIIWRLWPDLSFSRGSEVEGVVEAGELSDEHLNKFVSVQLRPDVVRAKRVLSGNSTNGPVAMPALGSDGKVLVLVPSSPYNSEHATTMVFRGRVTELSDLDLEDTLRTAFKKGKRIPTQVSPEVLGQAIGTGATSLLSQAGDEIQISASSEVVFEQVSATSLQVIVPITDRYNNEASWRLVLQECGLNPVSEGRAEGNAWIFQIDKDEGLESARQKLRKNNHFGPRVEEIHALQRGTVSELSVQEGELVLGQGQPGFAITSVYVMAGLALPETVFVVNTTDSPGTYWYLLFIVILLGLFVLLFGFGLVRSLR